MAITATGIKNIWYADPAKVTGDLTGTMLGSILKDPTTKKVPNVHQDTWSLDEAEPSTTQYKNQLTDGVYRQSKEMGEVTMNFAIGQYDYETKAAFMGGTGTETTWKRARGVTDIEKCMIALTEDDQYCVFPKASIVARNAETDGAVAINVVATALEPDNAEVSSEYWFDASEVTDGASGMNASGK